MLQPELLMELPPIVSGIQRFLYKNYTICLSDERPGPGPELPFRVVSIVDHTGKNEPAEQDLLDLLAYFGMDLTMPVRRATTEVRGNPARGNTQYYMQPVMVCDRHHTDQPCARHLHVKPA